MTLAYGRAEAERGQVVKGAGHDLEAGGDAVVREAGGHVQDGAAAGDVERHGHQVLQGRGHSAVGVRDGPRQIDRQGRDGQGGTNEGVVVFQQRAERTSDGSFPLHAFQQAHWPGDRLVLGEGNGVGGHFIAVLSQQPGQGGAARCETGNSPR